MSDFAEEPRSTPPPVICVNDRVLLEYAFVDDSVGYNAGHGLMFVGTEEIGKVPCLAICKDKDSEQFMLYYCDRDWSPIGSASYETVAAAKRRAERIYPGSSVRWIEARITEEDAKRYLEARFADTRCSFCGKMAHERMRETFEGEGSVRICGTCVRELYGGLKESSRGER